MASCNYPCGGSGSHSCPHSSIGALSCVNRSRNFPYYTGPCPPPPCETGCGCRTSHCDDGCGCGRPHRFAHADGETADPRRFDSDCDACGRHMRPQPPCGRPDGHRPPSCDYGVFAAQGPISLSAGCAIPLAARCTGSDAITAGSGCIELCREGDYFAAVTADIPVECCVDTVIQLTLDDQPLNPPRIALSTAHDPITTNYSGHTVFHARRGAQLRLITHNPLCVTDATAQPVFTVTLIRL